MSKESDDLEAELADKPVGYASPPYAYRWPKGYCPNRKGRPRKEKNMTTPSLPNEFQRRVLEEANKVIAYVDGKPFTNMDKLLLHLKTSERPQDKKLFLTLVENAMQAEHAWREEAVQNIIAYKEHWGPTFRARRALGQKVPDIYPDPDDVVVLSATEVEFLGPVNAEEADQWAGYEKFRNVCEMCANEIIEIAGFAHPVEEDYQRYLKIRRLYYRFNRHIPAKFKKKRPFKFPPFKPPSEPPAWWIEAED